VKYINFVVAIIFAFIYYSVKIPPTEKFNLWLCTFAIPVVFAVNIVLFLLYAILRRASAIFYLLPLLFNLQFVTETYGVKRLYRAETTCSQDTTAAFSLLSYNVSGLKKPEHANMHTFTIKDDKDSVTYKLRKWILENDYDVQCYQEFFDHTHNSYFKTIEAIQKKGYYYFFSKDAGANGDAVGLLTVSRFPIVNKGNILVSDNGFNRVIYTDIKIGPDTVRVINVHLESMRMKKDNPLYTDNRDAQKHRVKVILHKLKDGVFERSKQVEEVLAVIDTSSHPVICAGDFNELPYSYTYHSLRKKLKNSFEEKGKGFGFSYRGNTLQFLRIDNQFFSPGLDVVDFETRQDVPYSDHFPLAGKYALCREQEE
jgi:endonuclease/exonuclease/phosphatase family metal-dependent hydrolase